MFVTVHFDVAFQIVHEERRLLRADAPLFQQAAEHARDDILPAIEEAGHNSEQRCPAGDLQRLAGEFTYERRHCSVVECPRDGGTVCQRGLEELESCRVGAHLPHCSKIKVEMTHGFSAGVCIGFLAEHDLIDQLRGMTVPWRQPRDLDTCEVALKSLDKRHEIPNCEDVRLHEDPQILDIADRCKYRMFDHALPCRGDVASAAGDYFDAHLVTLLLLYGSKAVPVLVADLKVD